MKPSRRDEILGAWLAGIIGAAAYFVIVTWAECSKLFC
jgi:hypothetical protein